MRSIKDRATELLEDDLDYVAILIALEDETEEEDGYVEPSYIAKAKLEEA